MRRMDNSFFDSSDWTDSDEDLLYNENFIQALAAEETAMEENVPSLEDDLESLTPEIAGRTLLKRDMRKTQGIIFLSRCPWIQCSGTCKPLWTI